ncbi:MAG: nucleoside permease [Cyclobacteriaceae bacterium]
MNLLLKSRLSIMMFLQFFIWGGWYVTMGTFLANNLDANDNQIGMAYSTQSWGAIIAPFVFGLIADRFFNAERLLGVIHLIGAILMYYCYQAVDFTNFYSAILPYMVLYMPTLALVNSVSFRQMDDPSKDFSQIRVWGTVGWIVAGLAISFLFSWDNSQSIKNGLLKNTFLMSGIASLLLGLYSFSLPATPPGGKGSGVNLRQILGLDALGLLKDRNYLVFFLASVLICIPLAFYYQNANLFLTEIEVPDATGKMTIGQGSEVLFMLLLPLFLKKYGMKKTLLAGMLAWGIRYACFAFGDADGAIYLVMVGIALHGVCYDFFFVAGQIYTDSKAGEKIQSAAQGLITLATYGLGMLVGFWAAGKISNLYVENGGHDWMMIWLAPSIFALGVLLLFWVSFKNEKVSYD